MNKTLNKAAAACTELRMSGTDVAATGPGTTPSDYTCPAQGSSIWDAT